MFWRVLPLKIVVQKSVFCGKHGNYLPDSYLLTKKTKIFFTSQQGKYRCFVNNSNIFNVSLGATLGIEYFPEKNTSKAIFEHQNPL